MAEMCSHRYELWTYDGPDIGSHTLHGTYRTRWLAEWMGRGLRRYPPRGGWVYVTPAPLGQKGVRSDGA